MMVQAVANPEIRRSKTASRFKARAGRSTRKGRHPGVPLKKRSPAARRPRPTPIIPPEPEPAQPPATPVVPTPAQALREVVRRADEGNTQCLDGLRRLLDERPEIWQKAGDIAALAETAWIELLANGSSLARLAIPRALKAMKCELAGNRPTPLEEPVSVVRQGHSQPRRAGPRRWAART
jgi:hypothetical protein